MTLDTGFLIALERREERAWSRWRVWAERGVPVTIPTPVLIEWWRGRGPYRLITRGALLEPLSESTAREAGRALSVTGPGPSVVDAAIMASAAQRQDVVYACDTRDLELLQAPFPKVRVIRL